MKKIILTLTHFLGIHAMLFSQSPSPFAGGSGIPGDPYLITTPVQLDSIRHHPNKAFQLGNDIDMNVSPYNQGSGWEPLGNISSKFTGEFRGGGHVIKNLYINRPEAPYTGFFGYTAASSIIDYLGFAGGKVIGGDYTGCITGSNSGIIMHCYNAGLVTGGNIVGGLTGFNDGGTVTYCYSTGSVSGTGNAGGLVGKNDNNGNIKACYSTGMVKGTGGGFAGAFISGSVTNCFYGIQTSEQTQAIGVNTGAGTVTGKTTVMMKKYVTYGASFFDKYWKIISDKTYPTLENIEDAPFAFRDTLRGEISVDLSGLLLNDYDIEEDIAGELVYRIENVYVTKGTLSGKTYNFHPGSESGFTDSLLYSVGKVRAIGDTLWGNSAKAVLVKHPQGEGTKSTPYLIYTYTDLKYMAKEPRACYRLMADIDASPSKTDNQGKGWEPVGNENTPFTGELYGYGKVIRNLYINRPGVPNIGLFAYTGNGCVIEYVGIAGGIIDGGNRTGSLVGYNISGTIFACYNTATIKGFGYVGGLLGYNHDGLVKSCYNTGTVIAIGRDIGGLVGGNNGTITNCYNTGMVTGKLYVGGVVGYNVKLIENCYNAGILKTTDHTIGGVVGNNKSGTVTACYFDLSASGPYEGIGINNIDPSTGAYPKSTAEMQQQSTFADWNFDKAWKISQNKAYPALQDINNAPVAVADTLSCSTTVNLSDLLRNDFDYETGPNNLVCSVTSTSGAGFLTKNTYLFPPNSLAGVTDTLRYRVGELVTANDTLWGNYTKAILTIATNFRVDVDNITIRAAENSTGSFNISTNTKWSAVSTENWLTFNPLSNTKPSIVTVTATQNKTGAKRSAFIIISAAGVPNDTVTVVQDAQMNISVTLVAENKDYDGNTKANVSVTINERLAKGDDVTVNASNAQFDSKNAGTGKTVIANITLSGADAGNYTTDATAKASANITAIPLTIGITAQNKDYNGNTNATVTASIASGLIAGDDITVEASNAQFDNKNAGTDKTVTANITLSGADAGNYTTDAAANASANITAIPLTIGITAQNKDYNGNTNATVTVSITSGLIAGDDVTANATNAQFDNASAGAGKTVTAGILLNGTDAVNYTCNPIATTTADISNAPTAIADISSKSGNLAVYPTINNGSFNVTINHSNFGEVSIRVISPAGHILKQYLYHKNQRTETYELNIGAASSGTYMVEVSMGTWREVKWIVVQ